MKKAYLIVGTTGEYDDFYQWEFGVYLSEQNAKYKVAQLNGWLKENGAHKPHRYDSRVEEMLKSENCLDPRLNCDCFTGSEYEYREVDLLDA